MKFLRFKTVKKALNSLKVRTRRNTQDVTNDRPRARPETPVEQPEANASEVCPPASDITRLPDELLILIFEFVHACYFGERYYGSFYEWLGILRVCTHWRDVMISTSRLWSVIPVTNDLNPLEYCLSLHGNTPLEIRMYDPWLPRRSSTLLRPHTPSIRSLALHMMHMNRENFPFDDMLTMNIPDLEELKILPEFVFEDRIPPRSVIRLQKYPRLRRLELRGVISPPDITNLRTIKLEKCSWAFSFQSFIRALDSCSQLVEMHLKQSLHSLARTAPQEIPASLRRATLPNLRKLDITDNTASIVSTVIAHLDTPAIASLRLVCYKPRIAQDEEAQASDSDSENLFRTLIPADPSRVLPKFPPEAGPFSASLAFMQGLCIVRVESTVLPFPLSVNLQVQYSLDWTRVFPAALQDISDLFGNSIVTELVVDASSSHILPSIWEDLFTSLPFLQRLELTSDGICTTMWQGLQRASAWAAQPCCPQLARVRVQHTPWPEEHYVAPPDERALEIIAEALRERAEYGAKLDELVWAVYLHHRDPDYADASRVQFLAPLVPLVKRMTYRTWGDGDKTETTFSPKKIVLSPL
ncbi:uncharacterized protein TRAVEDRAFT_53060 [Trametes versicolor FP-101664 SS1]|uniref:uncharacterized protein n=1 Tax=Trametes versicolor (strain FP-101664) TaxID=717944 RepID=UPI00046243A1|nr:uncharacterized protein TRAVEDRAFT_53060 [Trametes versicolor FP-101664 SS1]EIW52619.1 hypothetical protein TRAVEDRAFT_53060 [Trametes versicolor FP-101664 SS1]